MALDQTQEIGQMPGQNKRVEAQAEIDDGAIDGGQLDLLGCAQASPIIR